VAHEEAPEATVRADIDAFPWLPPLLLGGNVAHVEVVLRNVGVDRFRFDRLEFDLDGVEISRRSLFNDREVVIEDIDEGTVTAELSLESVTRMLGGRQLPQGELTGRVSGRNLVLRAGPLSVTVPLPRASLLPCDGQASVTAERVIVSCTVTDVPPGLVEAVSRAR
jgi:hypothetical protein